MLRRVVASMLLALLLTGGTARATTVLPLDLAALAAGADRIFLGRVERVESGRDAAGLPATWITFAVDEKLKGTPARHLTIKQLGVRQPLADGTLLRVAALPTYREGDEVLLFLHPDSAAGYTSPVGLGQGRFQVRRGPGQATAENDVANANLMPATAARTGADIASDAAPLTRPQPIALDDLLARVRALVGDAR